MTVGFTREQWCQAFAPEANRRVLDWIIGWTTHEIGVLDQPTCQGFNLLNTHLGCENGGGPNAMCCSGDSGHIRRFSSLQEGAQGNRSVLAENHPGYAAINDAIKANDINTLLTSAAVRQGLYTWVGFHTYDYLAPTFEGQGALHRYDTFLYGSPGSTPPAPTGGIGGNATDVTCTPGTDGSCSVCTGGIGSCPTDQVCVQFNTDGSVVAIYNPIQRGVCVTNDYAKNHAPAGGLTGGAGNTLTGLGLPNWLLNPDWVRVTKVAVGGVIIFAAVGLAGYVLVEKVDTSAPVRAVKDVTKTIAAAG